MSAVTDPAASAAAADSPLLVDRDTRGVVTLTLNRPRAFNALSRALLQALREALAPLREDAQARVVVLRGAGKAFCAGHDLREMRPQAGSEGIHELFELCGKFMQDLVALPQPVIACVHGMATAAGCQLVAQADLAVASLDASFATSGVNLGLFCSTPSVPLGRNLPRKRAMEMLLTGEFIDAATAADWGLVNRAVPADRLEAELEALVASILGKPAQAIALGKSQFYRQMEMGLAGAYQLASQTMVCNFHEPDTLEGVQAFLEKRPPSWKKPL